jgi:hypothetical protein
MATLYLPPSRANPAWEGEFEKVEISLSRSKVCAICGYTLQPVYMIIVGSWRYDRCHGCIGRQLIEAGLLW